MNNNKSLSKLNDFNAATRRKTLEKLAERDSKEHNQPGPREGWVNMHCHTFFSFNAYGYSPSRFAWEAHKEKLEAAGIVDFDCLEGTEEFLNAGKLLKLKSTAGFETRAFIPEYKNSVINSPKEPGVFYFSAAGFVSSELPHPRAAQTLESMRRLARERNISMMHKINDYLDDVAVDYENDILPRTPAGNATERHMLSAYEEKARNVFPDADRLIDFWAAKLKESKDNIVELIDSPLSLKALIRKKLMKHGGVGYVQPDSSSFPDFQQVVDMSLQSGAIPSACWLDGSSEGESDARKHLEFMKEKGCAGVTIIPDRNWNVPAEEKEEKIARLNEVVEVGKELDMIFLVGTEMNKNGNKFVDDFDAPALSPHVDTFRKGALAAWGHTLLQMCCGIGMCGEWSQKHFGENYAQRNQFFAQIGSQPYPSPSRWEKLSQESRNSSPDDLLKMTS